MNIYIYISFQQNLVRKGCALIFIDIDNFRFDI